MKILRSANLTYRAALERFWGETRMENLSNLIHRFLKIVHPDPKICMNLNLHNILNNLNVCYYVTTSLNPHPCNEPSLF